MKNRGARQGGRRSIRIRDYDYSSAGAYFITVCSQNRENVLGTIENDEIELTSTGEVVLDKWMHLREHFPALILDTFVVMPNHIHAIIVIQDLDIRKEGAETAPLQRPTLGQVIAYFKYQTTKLINSESGTPGQRFWQRNYYEHVIRSEGELRRARAYILTNPLRWTIDHENPASGDGE